MRRYDHLATNQWLCARTDVPRVRAVAGVQGAPFITAAAVVCLAELAHQKLEAGLKKDKAEKAKSSA